MRRKTSSKEPTQRQLRVGEQLKQIIAQTMLRGHFSHRDLLDASQVTVSEVRVSPDLKNATAYVMTLGGANIDTILPALNDEAHTFQKEINRQSEMIGYINAFHLYYWIAFSIIPLVWLAPLKPQN